MRSNNITIKYISELHIIIFIDNNNRFEVSGMEKDDKDVLLMAHLRQNARESLTKLSKKTRIPVSTIFDRLKHAEYIKRHTCLLDFERLGFNARVNVALKVDKKDKENIREYLFKHQNVNSLYKINNGYDFMVEAVFRSLKDAESFLEKLDEDFKIKSKQAYYIIDELAREKFLSEPEIADIAMK
ncbi:Lrp/AsnC family transcriptional regulator [Candidatus Woesearchaeota archaeon]|nr:MAG: Lrp/AsnC family transcriptional regulator [Candidatus Woesearchaeota archaeon]